VVLSGREGWAFVKLCTNKDHEQTSKSGLWMKLAITDIVAISRNTLLFFQ